MKMSTVLLVRVLVIDAENKKILVLRRAKHKLFAGQQEPPGGKVNEGESLKQAVYREVMEEAGVKIHNVKHIGDFDFDNEYGNFLEHIFYSEVTPEYSDVKINSDEHEEFKWINIDEFLSCDLHPNLRKVFKGCEEHWNVNV